MGAAREGRESEKILRDVWGLLPNLIICVWHPLKEDAIEYIDMIIPKLEKVRELLKEGK